MGHLCTLLRRDSPRRQPTLTPEEPLKWEDYSKDQRGKPPTEQRLLHTFTQGVSNRTSGRRVLSTSSYEGHAKHIDNPPGSRPRSLRKTLERYLAARRHCHSVSSVPMRYAQGRVAVRLTATGTFRVEWQCASHCHSVSSVPMRYAQGRVAVRLTSTGTLRVEWQCTSHCHSMVNVRGQYAQGRVAVRLTSTGTFRAEWQCRPRRPQIRKCYVDVRMRPE